MAIGDLHELVFEQTAGIQSSVSVYHFEHLAGAGDQSQLADWFETNVVPLINDIEAINVINTEIRVRNLFDDTEVHQRAVSGAGTITPLTNEYLPTFAAIALKLNHDNGSIRPGFKRYRAADEADADSGVWSSGYITKAALIGAELVNPPLTPNPDWAHVVVKRIKVIDGEEITYRLPVVIGEKVIGTVQDVDVESNVTTQNSRKWYNAG